MSEKYHLPRIQLSEDAKQVMMKYKWPGNVRQLKNITEQMSVLCTKRDIDVEDLLKFIPMNEDSTQLATIPPQNGGSKTYESEREMLFKILYEMRGNVSDLRREINSLRQKIDEGGGKGYVPYPAVQGYDAAQEIAEPENLNIADISRTMLEKALERNGGNRKKAAKDLGLSDRTLYRRLKEYGL
jgi:DNA-binding NtrC family response regulator